LLGACSISALAVWALNSSQSATPPSMATGSPELLDWIAGTEMTWGDRPSAQDFHPPRCPILATRPLVPSRSGVPGAVRASAAFDTRPAGGLFEITVQSGASVDEVARVIVERFGPPTERVGQSREWDMGDLKLRLAGARPDLPFVSVVVAKVRSTSEAYYAACPNPS
jgi:hypothetical protein